MAQIKPDTPTERVLKLICYLNHPFGRTKTECLEFLKIGHSSFYKYLHIIDELGIIIDRQNEAGTDSYRVNTDRTDNTFFMRLFDISEEERYLLSKAIQKLDINQRVARHLEQKLLKIFDNELTTAFDEKDDLGNIRCEIQRAIQQKQQVIFADYHSGNSMKVSDRWVEPFIFSDSLHLVWAYDVEKKANRQFKVSRIGNIKPAHLPWENENQHRVLPTDIFRNTGMLDKEVVLQLNLRAYNLLIEEYPLAEKYIDKQGNNYRLKADVAKYEGPARFVLGLWDDVEIAGDKGFDEFIEKRIQKINSSSQNADSDHFNLLKKYRGK